MALLRFLQTKAFILHYIFFNYNETPMKNILLVMTFALSLSLTAQPVLETTLTGENQGFYPFSTNHLGTKLFNSFGPDTFQIYNTNFSLYKNVVLPSGYNYESFENNLAGSNGITVNSICDNLYSNDGLLEFIISNGTNAAIINENGQIIFTFPDSIIGAPSIGSFNDTFKIWYSVSNANEVRVYTLPGSLPCNQCNFGTGLVPAPQGNNLAGLLAHPNPFNSTLTIEYTLLTGNTGELRLYSIDGKLLRTIPLTTAADKLTLNTTDLPQGTIIASLYGSNRQLLSKKLLKIE